MLPSPLMRVFTTTKPYTGDEIAEWAAIGVVDSMPVEDWVRQVTMHSQRHGFVISARDLVLLCDRQSHLALTATRLAALADLVPVEAWPTWSRQEAVEGPLSTPPPLTGGRSTVAPPRPLANTSSRVKDFVTN